MSDELPAGWAVAALGELLAEGPTNGYSPESTPTATGALTLKLSATTTGELILDENTTKRIVEQIPDGSKFWLKPGDILVQRANSLEYVGTAAIFDGPSKTYMYPDLMMRLRSRDDLVESAYLWRFINSRAAKEHLHGRATGTAGNMPKISGATLRELPVVVPPLDEQRRIVGKLDALTAKSRRAKEALDAIPALLERFRKAVLAAAFGGDLTADWREKNPDVEPAEELLKRIRAERRRRWEEAELAKMRAKGKVPGDDRWKEKYEEPAPVDASALPELPEGWCWASIDEVSSCERPICYGVVQPGDEDENGVPLVRVCDLDNGTVLTTQLRTVNAAIDAEYSRSRLEGGEVLVSVVGTIGRVAVAPPETAGANIARAVARVVVEAVSAAWLAAWLSSTVMQHRLNLDAREVARKTLNIDTLRRCAVPVGPCGEMSVVEERVRALHAWTRKVDAEIHSARAAHDLLDRAILAKAFRGELVPQDPNDEPASVLLERLRAEREQNGKTTNGAGRRRAAASPPPASSNPADPGRKPHASRRSQAPARSRG